MAKKRFSIAILVLSTTCAFLSGILGGYFLFYALTFMRFTGVQSHSIVSSENYKFEQKVRRDIVFYNPGNDDLWKSNYKEIPDGEGTIKGSIYIENKPARDLEFALILASGRRSKKVTVGLNGKYHIKLPKEKYFFNGIVIYNMGDKIHDKFLINKISKNEGMSILIEGLNNDAIQEKYSQLESELGAKEAANAIFKGLVTSSPFRDKFPFDVGDEPFLFPDLIYRSPIAIISPVNNSKSLLKDMKFIWEPVDSAAYYKATITKIVRKGSTTSYRNVISLSNIESNQISYNDLFRIANDSEKDNDCELVEELKEKELYGFRVLAYNEDNKILTASSVGSTELSVFSITK